MSIQEGNVPVQKIVLLAKIVNIVSIAPKKAALAEFVNNNLK
jgi:hypothetical protein